MSAWPGKYVIGLTGNIATGKSVVRKMLEHLGAYGIDADALGHRAIAADAPGYQPVLMTFGRWVLASDGQINRTKLARVVFSDPDALRRLESIVHPLVGQAIDLLVRRSHYKVIVIEAIKLLESELGAKCDAIWVSEAAQPTQIERLVQKRGMSENAALQRIRAQDQQDVKIAAADVVIHNDHSFEDTWQQVVAAWREIFPSAQEGAGQPEKAGAGLFKIQHAGPRQAEEIASFITQSSQGAVELGRADVMAAFGEKAYILLKMDGKLVGLAGWQVENLVARTGEIYLSPGLPVREAMQALTDEVELASRELQCEVSLIFLPAELVKNDEMWRGLGYQPRTVQSLGVRAWQEAAIESMTAGSTMYFKQLRKDRVLRPV